MLTQFNLPIGAEDELHRNYRPNVTMNAEMYEDDLRNRCIEET
jgi:hypothetical protein